MADAYQFQPPPPERRDEPQIAAQRAAVRAQIDPWVALLTDPTARREAQQQALVVMQERRSGLGPARIHLGDDGVPVTPNRIVVRRADVDEVVARLAAEYYAPQMVSIPGLDQVCVLVGIGSGARSLRASSTVARTVPGGLAAPSHVSLLGAIRKAEGGPEPSGPSGDGRWQIPDERDERPESAEDQGPSAEDQGPSAEDQGPSAEDQGPLVVVIDNGVSAEQRTDGWLAGLASTDNLDPLNVVPVDEYLDLAAGHGTFATGVVQQVAPGARLVVRSALDTEGEGDEVDIAREIVRAARDGAEVINLSLGFQTADHRPPLAMEEAIRTAIRIAEDDEENPRHLLVVCAAGNYGDRHPCWPAAFSAVPEFGRHVVSVAALRLDHDDDQQVVGAEWSSHGDWVTCSTLGQGVVSTYVVGKESPTSDRDDPDTFGPNSWATWSGTSFAAPQVAGAVVQMVRDGRAATAREALDALLDEARKHFETENEASTLDGYGVPLRILPV
jgi:subtilisin family serine protease